MWHLNQDEVFTPWPWSGSPLSRGSDGSQGPASPHPLPGNHRVRFAQMTTIASESNSTTARAITAVSAPLRPMSGTGMNSRLVIGQGSGVDHVDPFIAMMHDDVPPHVMFPTHPHRGVEIITYGIGGALYHEDTLGNAGTVVAGGVERNLFGRGFSHSEQPVGGVPYRGFQLFILLSAEDRNIDPTFQLLPPDAVPEVTADGVLVRVVAGEYAGKASPIVLRNPTQYLDVHVDPGHSVSVPVPAGYQGLAYVISGMGRIGTPHQHAHAGQEGAGSGDARAHLGDGVEVGAHQRLILGQGDCLNATAHAQSHEPLRFLVIAGRPVVGEPQA